MFADIVDEEYDYIVVGSGAGGGPVAANLAKAGFRVLLLEAGGAEEPDEYKVPAFHAFSAEHNDLAWKFFVRHYRDNASQSRDKRNFVPEKDGVFYPRAGTLGGCTAHHAMIFVAPHHSDWNHIARVTGDPSWSSKNMRRYFERIERCGYLDRPWHRWLNRSRHGFDGWLPTTVADPAILLRDSTLARLVVSVIQTCFEAKVWNSLGFRRLTRGWFASLIDPSDWQRMGLFDRLWNSVCLFLDPNDWRRTKVDGEGPVFTPLTIRDGVRYGTRDLLRETTQFRPDLLTIKLNALATRVLFDEQKRAMGVEYIEGKNLYRAGSTGPSKDSGPLVPQKVRARREIILSGGTFNTPQLLMLSGIGPRQQLEALGISVKVDSPGVGKNLQDRYEVGIVHRMRQEHELLRHAALRRNDPEFAEWSAGHGLYSTNGVLLAIIKRSSLDQPDPDLFLFAIPGEFSGYVPGYSERGRKKDYLTWVILKAHTRNTGGVVQLRSQDPCDQPRIDFNYFQEGSDPGNDDLDAVVAGIEFVRKISRRGASVLDEEIPGAAVRSREELAQFVKDNAWGHHACGTCKIGADGDEDAVLDGAFRVRGVKGLRVVDASIFPKIPGFFILSAIYMAAEKASDAIIAEAQRNR